MLFSIESCVSNMLCKLCAEILLDFPEYLIFMVFLLNPTVVMNQTHLQALHRPVYIKLPTQAEGFKALDLLHGYWWNESIPTNNIYSRRNNMTQVCFSFSRPNCFLCL